MGTVKRGEAGYALLDSLIALALITVTLSSIAFALTSARNHHTELVERTAAVVAERNRIAGGGN